MLKNLIVLSLIFFIGCTNSNTKQEKYMFIKGINLYQKGKTKEALDQYKKIYEMDSKNVVVIREMALLSYELGDINSSIKFYEEAYKLDPSDRDTIKNLINIYYSIGDYKNAKKYLEKISVNNDNDLLKLKGYILYSEGKYSEAYDILKNCQFNEDDSNFIRIFTDILTKVENK